MISVDAAHKSEKGKQKVIFLYGIITYFGIFSFYVNEILHYQSVSLGTILLIQFGNYIHTLQACVLSLIHQLV